MCDRSRQHTNLLPKRRTANVIVKPLAFVINISLATGMFLNELKMACITPAYKLGTKDSFDNYRPISALSKSSKSVYTNNSWTILRTTNNYQIDGSDSAGTVPPNRVLYMSKSFDTIPHATIINNLPSYGISGIGYQWRIGYLFARKQQVLYQGTTSGLSSMFGVYHKDQF